VGYLPRKSANEE
jgi:hypothetical protein